MFNLIPAIPVWLLAVIIAVVATVFWFLWAPHIWQTRKAIAQLSKQIRAIDSGKPDDLARIEKSITNQNIAALFRETRSGLFELPGDVGAVTYSLRPYQDIWTPRALLAQKVNLSLFEAMPNLLIGIGLMLTFFYLAIALNMAQAAMGEQNIPAIGRLLDSAGSKFWTSISGLLCSVIWSIASKHQLESLNHEIESLSVAFGSIAADTGAESAITTQVSLLAEMLSASHEQVGQLKRFETDFAVAIAKAMDNALRPAFEGLSSQFGAQMDEMTGKLTNALDQLSKNLGQVNEDALAKMVSDFGTTLRDATESEMESFKNSLLDLSEGLNDSATDILQATQAFEQALLHTKANIVDMNETLERASSAGQAGAQRLESTLGLMADTTTRLDGVMHGLGKTIADVDAVIGRMEHLGDNMAESSEAQREVVKTLQSQLPTLRDSVQSVVSTLQMTAAKAESSFKGTNEAFTATNARLDNTLESLQGGITRYTEQVVELHVKLDGLLSKALSSINGSINHLAEVLEDMEA